MADPSQRVPRFLLDWRLGFLFMTAGVLIGAAVYYIFPGDHQAMATVIVDMNVEQNWSGSPDNEIFYFLDRETRKLEEVAWSDEVLARVTDETGISVADLRGGVLNLSQPKDGGWHLFAKAQEAGVARKTAKAWALAFSEGVNAELKGENNIGVLENITVTPAQVDNLPVQRAGSLSVYILIGALGGWLIGMLVILFRKA